MVMVGISKHATDEHQQQTGEVVGFRDTETGPIPADWKLVSVGSLFSFKNGLNKAKQFFGYGTPIINYMDVFSISGLRSGDIAGLVDVSRKEIDSFSCKKGDVFFTRTSETLDEIGVASVLLENIENAVFSGFVLRARPINDDLVDDFKKYCFASKSVRQQIVSKGTYTTRALTNGRVLSSILLVVPPTKAEQQAIADSLNDADAQVEALEQLIAKKQAVRQAAMQQLLTGKTRLPGFRGKWETTSMGHIGSSYGGLSGKSKRDFGDGDARYVTFLSVLENVILNASHIDHVHVVPSESQNRVLKGDLLFNGTSETPGDLAMGAVMDEQIPNLYLNSFCFGFRIRNRNKYDPLFLAYFFRGSAGRTIMSALAQGATRYNMSKGQFSALKLSIPSYDEQCAIATVLSDLEAEIAALGQRRDKARAIKQGMMQELLTGRVRLV